jgi:LysM repeat protein
MSFFGKWNTSVLFALFLAAAGGCSPTDSRPMDEEKEPHYVLGKSEVNALNYPGAIEAFEEALEANPHSAQAHFQLAMLFENQESDPAAAIYHYQQYLKYDSTAGNAELITQHIAKCKQQLAENVLELPSAPAVQQQLEKLTEENRHLHDQLAQWQAYFASQQSTARTNPPTAQHDYSTPSQPTSPTPDDITAQPYLGAGTSTPGLGASTGEATGPGSANPAPPRPQHPPSPPPSKARRTHLVTSGETLAGIARKQGINLAVLEKANPAVNPKKLRAGQILILPEP